MDIFLCVTGVHADTSVHAYLFVLGSSGSRGAVHCSPPPPPPLSPVAVSLQASRSELAEKAQRTMDEMTKQKELKTKVEHEAEDWQTVRAFLVSLSGHLFVEHSPSSCHV